MIYMKIAFSSTLSIPISVILTLPCIISSPYVVPAPSRVIPSSLYVIPAKAGIQANNLLQQNTIVIATNLSNIFLDPRLRGDVTE